MSKTKREKKGIFSDIKILKCLTALLGSVILAFAIYNVHSISDVTEGGVLGLTLLFEYWLNISPSITGFFCNVVCYVIGWKLMGKSFIFYSVISTLGFSFSYAIFEMMPPVYPQIAQMPLLASIVGALLVGIGSGLCVRVGGAPTGDDALAMSVSKLTRLKIQWIYFISDAIVLLLSLSYIPIQKIMYSLLTVILSGQVIGIMQNIKLPEKKIKKTNIGKDCEVGDGVKTINEIGNSTCEKADKNIEKEENEYKENIEKTE